MQFRAFEANIEVNGQTVFAIIDGFSFLRKIPSGIMVEEGIGELGPEGLIRLDPDGWYSQEAWLRAFERIAKDIGGAALRMIGQKIPENAIFPPWVTDIHSAIKSVDIAYHLNHRKGGEVMFNIEDGTMTEGIGHYGCEPEEGAKRIVSVCANPYPCDFDRGILETMARKFEPRSRVEHDQDSECRDKGADSCTYEVLWS